MMVAPRLAVDGTNPLPQKKAPIMARRGRRWLYEKFIKTVIFGCIAVGLMFGSAPAARAESGDKEWWYGDGDVRSAAFIQFITTLDVLSEAFELGPLAPALKLVIGKTEIVYDLVHGDYREAIKGETEQIITAGLAVAAMVGGELVGPMLCVPLEFVLGAFDMFIEKLAVMQHKAYKQEIVGSDDDNSPDINHAIMMARSAILPNYYLPNLKGDDGDKKPNKYGYNYVNYLNNTSHIGPTDYNYSIYVGLYGADDTTNEVPDTLVAINKHVVGNIDMTGMNASGRPGYMYAFTVDVQAMIDNASLALIRPGNSHVWSLPAIYAEGSSGEQGTTWFAGIDMDGFKVKTSFSNAEGIQGGSYGGGGGILITGSKSYSPWGDEYGSIGLIGSAFSNNNLTSDYVSGGGVMGSYLHYFHAVEANIFYNNTVNLTHGVFGGGVLGVATTKHNSDGRAPNHNSGKIFDDDFFYNVFANNTVNITGSPLKVFEGSDPIYVVHEGYADASIIGGGIVGSNESDHFAKFPVASNVFMWNTVNASHKVYGGGVLGVNNGSINAQTRTYSNEDQNDITYEYKSADGLIGNQFVGNVVKIAQGDQPHWDTGVLYGGGIVGIHDYERGKRYISNIAGNFFLGNQVTLGTTVNIDGKDYAYYGAVYGGGIIGLNSNMADGGDYRIGTVNGNVFYGNALFAGSVRGGGIIGVYINCGNDTPNDNGILSISNTIFDSNYIYSSAGTIDGGIIGVVVEGNKQGEQGIAGNGLRWLDRTIFYQNTVVADDVWEKGEHIKGGLVYSARGSLLINNSVFANNDIYASRANNIIYGAVTLDSAIAVDKDSTDYWGNKDKELLSVRVMGNTLFSNNRIGNGGNQGGLQSTNSISIRPLFNNTSVNDVELWLSGIDKDGAAGTLSLYDPIYIGQNGGKSAYVGVEGSVIWGGTNVMEMNDRSQGIIDFLPGSRTTLVSATDDTNFALIGKNDDGTGSTVVVFEHGSVVTGLLNAIDIHTRDSYGQHSEDHTVPMSASAVKIATVAPLIKVQNIEIKEGAMFGIHQTAIHYDAAPLHHYLNHEIPLLVFDSRVESGDGSHRRDLIEKGLIHDEVLIGTEWHKFTLGILPTRTDDTNTYTEVGIVGIGAARYDPQVGASEASSAPTAFLANMPAVSMIRSHLNTEMSADLFAYRAYGERDRASAGGELSGYRGLTFWAEGGNTWLSHDGGYTNYEGKHPVFMLGADLFQSAFGMFGLAAEFGFPDFDGQYTDINAQTYSLFAYGGLNLPFGFDLSANVGGGFARYDQKRTVQVLGFNERISADHYGQHLLAGVELGRKFDLTGKLSARPFVANDYSAQWLNSYGEESAAHRYSGMLPTTIEDRYNLRYDDAFAGVYRLRVGAGLNYVIPQRRVSFGGAAYYQHRWGDLAMNTPIHFTNDPRGNRFTSRGDGLAPDVLGLSANARAQLTDRLSATVAYDFTMGENERSHRGQIGLALAF